MADLISRQAVIDVIVDWLCDIMDGKNKNGTLSERVNNLPSAQPEIIRCKDCKHRIENEHYGERGYMNLKAMCELDTGDPFELGRNAEDDEWFCKDGERREE